MRNNFKLIALNLTLGLTFFMIHSASALTTQQMAGQYLTDLGKSYYDTGNKEEAAHEFSKALLIDPSNQRARDNLNKMGFDQSLYKGFRTKLTEQIEAAQANLEARSSQPTAEQIALAKDLEIAVLQDKLFLANQQNSEEAVSSEVEDSVLAEESADVAAEENKQESVEQKDAEEAVSDQAKSDDAATADVAEAETKSYTQIPDQIAMVSGYDPATIDEQPVMVISDEEKNKYEDRMAQLGKDFMELREKMLNQNRYQENMIKALKENLAKKAESSGLKSREELLNKEVELLKNQKNLLAKIDELTHSLSFLDQDITMIKDHRMDLQDQLVQLQALEERLKDVQAQSEELRLEREKIRESK